MLEIDESECVFSFSRSSGPGGQNINKVNTKATLTWDIESSVSCSNDIKERFKKKYSRHFVEDKVVIHSQNFRSQKRNKQDCLDKLNKYLQSVEKPPKKRKPTKPTRSSIKKRLEGKRKQSEKKRSRKIDY